MMITTTATATAATTTRRRASSSCYNHVFLSSGYSYNAFTRTRERFLSYSNTTTPISPCFDFSNTSRRSLSSSSLTIRQRNGLSPLLLLPYSVPECLGSTRSAFTSTFLHEAEATTKEALERSRKKRPPRRQQRREHLRNKRIDNNASLEQLNSNSKGYQRRDNSHNATTSTPTASSAPIYTTSVLLNIWRHQSHALILRQLLDPDRYYKPRDFAHARQYLDQYFTVHTPISKTEDGDRERRQEIANGLELIQCVVRQLDKLTVDNQAVTRDDTVGGWMCDPQVVNRVVALWNRQYMFDNGKPNSTPPSLRALLPTPTQVFARLHELSLLYAPFRYNMVTLGFIAEALIHTTDDKVQAPSIAEEMLEFMEQHELNVAAAASTEPQLLPPSPSPPETSREKSESEEEGKNQDSEFNLLFFSQVLTAWSTSECEDFAERQELMFEKMRAVPEFQHPKSDKDVNLKIFAYQTVLATWCRSTKSVPTRKQLDDRLQLMRETDQIPDRISILRSFIHAYKQIGEPEPATKLFRTILTLDLQMEYGGGSDNVGHTMKQKKWNFFMSDCLQDILHTYQRYWDNHQIALRPSHKQEMFVKEVEVVFRFGQRYIPNFSSSSGLGCVARMLDILGEVDDHKRAYELYLSVLQTTELMSTYDPKLLQKIFRNRDIPATEVINNSHFENLLKAFSHDPERCSKFFNRYLTDSESTPTAALCVKLIMYWADSGKPTAIEDASAVFFSLKSHPKCKDLATTNAVLYAMLRALSVSDAPKTGEQACRLLETVEQQYQRGDSMEPSITMYTFGIQCCLRSGQLDLAEMLITRMNQSGDKPPMRTYLSINAHWSEHGTQEAAERTEQILHHLRTLPLKNNNNVSTLSYSIAVKAWQKSGSPIAHKRIWNIYTDMMSTCDHIECIFVLKQIVNALLNECRDVDTVVKVAKDVVQNASLNVNGKDRGEISAFIFLVMKQLHEDREFNVNSITLLLLEMVESHVESNGRTIAPSSEHIDLVMHALLHRGELVRATDIASKLYGLHKVNKIPFQTSMDLINRTRVEWRTSTHSRKGTNMDILDEIHKSLKRQRSLSAKYIKKHKP